MEYRILLALICALHLAVFSACGEEDSQKTIRQFRSKSIQHQLCISKNGEIQERCEQFEKQQVLQVQLIEDNEQRAWLVGIEREGETSRQILGSKDSDGGYIFTDQVIDKNNESGCELTRNLTLTLKPDETAEPCKALIGRETLEVRSSSACDENIESPAQYTRYIRKRWERDDKCGKDNS